MEITLAGLLTPYRTAAIAQAVEVDEDTVTMWKSGRAFPRSAGDRVVRLAKFLSMPPAELGEIIARGRRRRREARLTTA